MNDILPNKVAIFSCRFDLGSNSKIAPLLAKYSLATVLNVSKNRDVVSTHYPSEPVLAEASAQYTLNSAKLMSVLNHVHAALLCQHLEAPRDDVGEMCAVALLGLTMDKLRSEKEAATSILGGVSVDLKCLLSIFGCKDTPAVNTAPEGWEVNFTHFVRPPYNLDDKDLEILWKRRMAYYAPKSMKGLDLLIAIYHKEKGYATQRIQVKNHTPKFHQSLRTEALDIIVLRQSRKSSSLWICCFVQTRWITIALLLITKMCIVELNHPLIARTQGKAAKSGEIVSTIGFIFPG